MTNKQKKLNKTVTNIFVLESVKWKEFGVNDN